MRVVLVAAVLGACAESFAERKDEDGDGPPAPPCFDINIAVGEPKLALMGDPLRGCSVQISAGSSKISVLTDECHDPTYYDLRSSVPIRWELVSFPAGATPSFSFNSTLATLNLPRTGTYRVRFTICPTDNCTFRPATTGPTFPLRRVSREITITAVDAIPIPPEKYPVLPASATVATMPTRFVDKDCMCQGGGGAVDPQWVTTTEWNGAQDYHLLEGRVYKSWISSKDSFLNHRSQDANFNLVPDPKYRYLLSTEPEFDFSSLMGVEWESGSFPERFRPSDGDRVSVYGFWILDCGHPPFYTEIHPAVGLAVHRPRPVRIPVNESFVFPFSTGDVTATAGANVFVPGIITDLWFNRNAGEIIDNCSATGLHQPGRCFTCDPPQPNCPPWVGGPCIDGKAPINRIFEFNIYLPRDPSVSARMQGVTAPRTPLYVKVSNPWGFGGPEPLIFERREGDVTYLQVLVDLRGFNIDNYTRRIEAAWVLPSPDNWELNRWRVTFRTLDVHNDHDPWYTYPFDDGDWRFWMNLNNGDQEWTRILHGDENAHGTMTFNPPWRTGAEDPEFWRPFSSLDSQRRLGPDVLSYPDQGVVIATTAFEADATMSDDPGQIHNGRFSGAGTRKFTSHKGSYTIEVEVQPGPAVGAATLTAAADRLLRSYSKTCDNGPYLPPVPPRWEHPLLAAGYLVPGISEQPPWTVEANVAASLGASVAGVGDVNGDGFEDFLVGAPRFAGGTGQASVYLGFPGELSSAPYWTALGEGLADENIFFGQSVASAGDVNGDGLGDFLVGAPSYSNDLEDQGAAYLWLGGTLVPGSNASPATASWKVEGNQAGAIFGFAVASAGDVNGDGFGDVAVAAPFYNNTVIGDIAPRPLGRVFVYLGSSNGLSTVAHRTLSLGISPGNVGWLGYSLAGADLNKDGFSELIVGMPRYSNGQTDEGMVLIYGGSTNGLNPAPIGAVTELNRTGAMLGWSVAAAGDVDGDGYGDVVAGAPRHFVNDIFVGQGAAFLYRGSIEGLLSNPSWSTVGPLPGALLGSSVAGVGDLDGDGLSDVVVGAPGFSAQQSGQGAVMVFPGTSSPGALQPLPIWTATGPRAGAHFGSAVGAAGDVDHDGFSDFIVGAPDYENGQDIEGAIFVYRGCGPREIRPSATRFFRDVGTEEYVLFNAEEANFSQVLLESDQADPVKLGAMLIEMREELLANGNGDPNPEAVDELLTFQTLFPGQLWQQYMGDIPLAQGGALYLDCGGPGETVDTFGRRWKRDATYLSATDSHAAPGENEVVDVDLLSDMNLPNSVILGRRWIAGDLRYEIPVLNGLHTVILYFAESCATCVNPGLGGTGPGSATRLLDLDVEGRRVIGFNPADAAVPPDGDGMGMILKATEVVFLDVSVTDGVLNVSVLGKEVGGSNGEASINALAILQQPAASGLAPMRIASIEQAEGQVSIRVNPGPNLASLQAGLATTVLEQSTNLVNWARSKASINSEAGLLVFETASADPTLFFRVRQEMVQP